MQWPPLISSMRKAVTMTVTLETLELTPEELNSSKDVARKMAYFNWLDAGCPEGGQLELWLKAERQWIEQSYVPDRPLDGTRLQAVTPPERSEPDNREEPSPATSRRRGSESSVATAGRSHSYREIRAMSQKHFLFRALSQVE